MVHAHHVLTDGYPNEIKRKKDATNFLITTLNGYDWWGNAGSTKEPDTTFTCRTWDGIRNYVTQVREAMNGQTSCATSNGLDLTTSFVRDSWLRLTKTTAPVGDCQHREYDTFGRLTAVKLRDDCVVGNAGNTQETSYDTNGLAVKVEYKDSGGTVTMRQELTYHDGLQVNARINPMATSYSRSMSFAADGQIDTLTFENGIGKTKWLWDTANREIDRERYLDASKNDNWHSAYPSTPTRKSNSITDDMAKTTATSSDDLGRKSRTVSPDSGTTLFIYDNTSRLVTMIEAYGLADQVTHTYTYDHLGRKLTENYGSETCGVGGGVTEVTYMYDALPGSCPIGATCLRKEGRLAYAKEVLLCDGTQPDKTFDRELFLSYDDNGRQLQEFMKDDGLGGGASTTAIQAYTWDKNGNATSTTAPSGFVANHTRGDTANSDANLITAVTRSGNGGPTTNLLTSILYAPFGPPTQYDQANTVSGGAIRAMLSWNLAYRATQIKHRYTATGADRTKIDYTEDVKGRYTQKLYSNVHASIQSDYLQYDWLDRITCDAAVSGACPASGANLKSSVSTYNASNDRTVFKHQASTYGDYQYTITQQSGTDKIASFTQSGLGGSTTFGWDGRGNRTFEDDSNSTTDRRDYTYEGRRRVRTISGQFLSGGTFRNYVVTNAYDHRDRRVFRAFTNQYTGALSLWWYYYDNDDRLVEVKYIPLWSTPTTYSVYQFYWLGKRPVAMWGTDYPAATTGRFFMHADEANRVLEVMDWPAAGDANLVWASNPDVFGWEQGAFSTGIYQPLRLNSMQYEERTQARKTGFVDDRPALLTQGGGMYDPLTASYLQPFGVFPNESYALRAHNPSVAGPTQWRREQYGRGHRRPEQYLGNSGVVGGNGVGVGSIAKEVGLDNDEAWELIRRGITTGGGGSGNDSHCHNGLPTLIGIAMGIAGLFSAIDFGLEGNLSTDNFTIGISVGASVTGAVSATLMGYANEHEHPNRMRVQQR